MPNWTDRFAWNTPKDRFIAARLPDGTDVTVTWNPLLQSWEDFDGKPCNGWVEWREIEDD